jgi:hypothetical protein
VSSRAERRIIVAIVTFAIVVAALSDAEHVDDDAAIDLAGRRLSSAIPHRDRARSCG